MNKCLVVDIWEADVLLDEKVLMENGIKAAVIRINDMQGGHHLDKNFTAQAQQCVAAGMLWMPYFVYNPWVDAAANYQWLIVNLPRGVKRVCVDAEVRYPGYPPATYAKEFAHFCDMVSGSYKVTIYTGQGYVNIMSAWPTRFDYWWAQYVNSLYSSPNMPTTWDGVRAVTDTLNAPVNASFCPGPIKMWQCSGDRLYLPGGAGKALDVNIFFGTETELEAYFGAAEPAPVAEPPPPVETTVPAAGAYYGVSSFPFSNQKLPATYALRPRFPIRKTGTKTNLNVGKAWQDWIKALQWVGPGKQQLKQQENAYDLYCRWDACPTVGFTDTGLLKVLSLIFPGNIVYVSEITTSEYDGQKWATVVGLPEDTPPTTVADYFYDRPDVIHNPYQVNARNQLSEPSGAGLLGRWPVIGTRYIPLDQLVPLTLPKAVVTTHLLNIRQDAGTNHPVVGSLMPGVFVTVYELKVGKGGLWGRISLDGSPRWICLRYYSAAYPRGIYYTTWKL